MLTICANGDTFCFEFNSDLMPIYIDPLTLDNIMSGIVGASFESDQIYVEILRASLAADKYLGLQATDAERYEYVAAKTEYQLLNRMLCMLVGRPAKIRLGDLTLDYGNNAMLLSRLNALGAKLALYEGTGSMAVASKASGRETWVEARW